MLLLVLPNGSAAQNWADHHDRNTFLPAPAAAFGDGLLGYANPANARLAHGDARFVWQTRGANLTTLGDWGLFTGGRGTSFNLVRRRAGQVRTTDYRFNLGFGHRGLAGGLAYQWSSGDEAFFGLQNMISAGLIARPDPRISVGVTANLPTRVRTWEAVAEIGLRPLGSPALTLFADGALREDRTLAGTPWSAGASVEIVPGLRMVGRYLSDERLTAGIRVDFGRAGGGSHVSVSDGTVGPATYMIRAGQFTPDALAQTAGDERRRMEIELDGRIDYRSPPLAGLFGDVPPRLYELLDAIDAAARDDRVSVIAVRMAGTSVLPEHAWEIREALRRARRDGKTVLVYLEDAGMTGYHLASVADRVIMDPMGTLLLPGYLSNQTYFADALQKLDLGFDAWRYYEYKSAVEPLSRSEMSEADRRQRSAYVDEIYELVRTDVAASRELDAPAFDRLVDEHTYFTADQARESGLVDTLARWHDRDELIASYAGERKPPLSPEQILADRSVDRQWGRPARIAVVYGLGATARESGMNARDLAERIRELAEDRSVDAVVFRVDSPGGDPLAADLVAEALRTVGERKPVVVSQGQVAGSGGYWVSMYGDRIVAGPNTVTGSIGVIGGWLYDRGLADRLGLKADHVQRGEHADVTAGISLLGLTLPERNLTEAEQDRVETNVRAIYDQFVAKVAEGRDTTEAHVREVAEGRIYSGRAGREVGLVDEIGGLLDAIRIARHESDLPDDRPVEILEYGGERSVLSFGPLRALRGEGPLLDLNAPFTRSDRAGSAAHAGKPSALRDLSAFRDLSPLRDLSAAGSDDGIPLLEAPLLEYLRVLSAHQPAPLVLLRPGLYPTYDDRSSAR